MANIERITVPPLEQRPLQEDLYRLRRGRPAHAPESTPSFGPSRRRSARHALQEQSAEDGPSLLRLLGKQIDATLRGFGFPREEVLKEVPVEPCLSPD